ncbi:MAG: calcium/sodium antiporter [Ignavibacteriales bacterium]|nr:calcium/sodium antiporter [Ignavibacteriales bacterium]MBP9120560.1 calcium/sodium antiporter [Ignavibacterium sp.]
MTELEIVLYLAGGLILLFVGAEGLIRGSSNLAIKMGITPLVVGLTVVAFGTSTPELVVSLKAALIGNSSISLGNVVGSNIANIALILGVAALIRPLDVHAKVIMREIPIMIGISVLLLLLLIDGELGFFDGLVFVFGIVIYTVVNVMMARKEKNSEVDTEFKEGLKSKLGIRISIILMIGGLGLLIVGANLFVQSAVAIAKMFNISDAIIGLTIVAVGTSLPELITSIVAAYKKESDIAIGNVVGSNIFNILGILGITALIIPISSVGISYIDLVVMVFTAIILFPLSRSGFSISRFEGAILLIGYFGYVYYLLPK